MASLLQRLGNTAGAAWAQLNPFDGGEDWNSYQAKKRKEEQMAAARQPQPQPQAQSPQQRVQGQIANPLALNPRPATPVQTRSGVQQNQVTPYSAAQASRNSVAASNIAQDNANKAQQARDAIKRQAEAQLAQKVSDVNNYYGSDAAALRDELRKGAIDANRVQGLTTSLANRQKELRDGSYAQSTAYNVQQRLKPVVPQGLSYDDMAAKAGVSTQQAKDYVETHHKGYGDQGLVKNALNAGGKFLVDTGVAATQLAQKPINEIFDKPNQVANLDSINQQFQSGQITGDRAMELAGQEAGRGIGRKATYNDKTGQIEFQRMNPLEFGGQFTQSGVDAASVLPIGGGVASGLSKFTTGGMRTGLEAVGKTLTAGAQTQAESQLARHLASKGIGEQTAKVVGNALTSNAKQSAIYGTAQTASDVLNGNGITPQSLALNYGADFAMGAAPEIGLGVPGAHITRTIPHNNLMKNSPEYRAMAETAASTTNTLEKNLLEQKMEGMRARSMEGGFIGGQNATGFADAQSQGRVFDGVDGKPRFEVDDSGAKLNDKEFSWGIKMDGKPRKVGQILEHDKLFEQYPELKDVNVRYEPNDLPGHDAHFDPATNSIVLTKSRADKSHLSDIIHELQHSIQEREGFAGGGAPEYRNYKAENASIKRGLQDVNTTLSGKNLTPEQTQRLRAKRDNLIKQLEQTQDQYGNVFTKAKDIADYRKLAGEAEARAVQARIDMPMSERYVKTPSMYHGTDAKFDKFDVSKVGTQKYADWGDGVYFDPRKSGADYYRKEAVAKRDPEVIKAYKNYENTLKKLGTKPMYESIDLGYGTPKYLEAEKARKAYIETINKAKSDPTRGRIIESYLDKNAKVKDVYVSGTPDPTVGDIAKREGYDAVRIHTGPKGDPDTFLDEILVINTKVIKDSPEVRSTFYDSLDVPKEDLIIRNDGGKAMSVEDQQAPKISSYVPEDSGRVNLSDVDSQYIRESAAEYKDTKDLAKAITEEVWSRNKTGQGTAIATPNINDFGMGGDTYSGFRVSNNSPFYSEYYRENGRKITKRAIYDMVQDEIQGKSTLLSKHMEAPYLKEIADEISERQASLDRTVSRAETPKVSQEAPRVEQQSYIASSGKKSPAKQAAQVQSRQSQRQSTKSQTKDSRTRTQHSPAGQQPRNTPAHAGRNPAGRTQSERQAHLVGTQNNLGEGRKGQAPFAKSISDNEAKSYVKRMSDEQDSARKNADDSLKEKSIAIRNDFKEKFIDNLSPIEDRMKQAIKNGAQIDTKNNIIYQLDRSRRSEGVMNAFVKDNSLDKIIQEVPNTKEFDQYLIAKHAAELEDNIQTGRNKAMDAALVKKLDGKYGAHAKKLYEYNQKLLDTSVEYGLISKDVAKTLKKQYPEYVPFNRIFNEDELAKLSGNGSGEASISKQTAVQKLKGSKRTIESPLESILDKTRVVVEQGERNRAAQMLASYRQLPGNPFNLKEIPTTEAIGTRSTISYLDNGVKRTFETDKTIADAAKNMTRQQIGLWGSIAAVPARVLRAGATGVETGFVASNIVRDIVGSAVNSRHPFRIVDPVAMGKALSAALHRNGEAYTELMRAGVAGQSFDMYRNQNKLNVGEVRSHKNLAARGAYNLMHPSRWYRTIEDTIGRSEDFGRALQYYSNKPGFEKKYGRGSEKASILAADQARSNATNFFRYGSVGKNINVAIPYWNATLQGTRINYNRLKERPVQTVAKIGLAIAAPSAMIATNNYSSEENRKVMERLPDSVKEGNIVILGPNASIDPKTGEAKNVYKWPVPPQHIGIHNLVQRSVEEAYGGRKVDIADAAGKIGENYTTINATDPSKTASTYVPQGLKLIAEPMTNTNFYTGEKIVQDSMQGLDKKDQVTSSTSLTAKKIGELTNTSPMVIDNVVRTGGGGAGQNVIKASDSAFAAAGQGSKDDVKGRTIGESISRRFVHDRGTTDGQIYFQTLDEAAKKNKLAGKDISIFNSLVDSKMDANGDIQGKNERDALNKYQNLAANPRVAKTISDAAKLRSEKTDEDVDPLYKLDHKKQMEFYNIKAQVRDSIEQQDLERKAGDWYKQLGKDRSAFFDKQDIKPAENDQRVKYPEPDKVTQAKMDAYYSMPDGDEKYAYLDANPEISKQFTKVSEYNNAVRKAQGVAELHDYPQASDRVKEQMDAKNWKDPEVAQYLQDINVYKIIEGASKSRLKGNEIDSKTLKAIQSTGKYNIVENEDGTFSLKYNSNNGYGEAGEAGTGGYGGRSGGSKGKSSSKKRSSGGGKGGKADTGDTEAKANVSLTRELNKKLASQAAKSSSASSKASTPKMKQTPLKKYSSKSSAPKISSSKKKSKSIG